MGLPRHFPPSRLRAYAGTYLPGLGQVLSLRRATPLETGPPHDFARSTAHPEATPFQDRAMRPPWPWFRGYLTGMNLSAGTGSR
jgi:hypothetical protein